MTERKIIDGLKFEFTSEELKTHLQKRIDDHERVVAKLLPPEGTIIIPEEAGVLKEAFDAYNQIHGLKQILPKIQDNALYVLSRDEALSLGFPSPLDKDDPKVERLEREKKKLIGTMQAQAEKTQAQAAAAARLAVRPVNGPRR